MARNFNDLITEMSPERQQRIRDRTDVLLLQIALQDLRKGRNFTQKQMAKRLGISQSALSKMEHQQDMNVSTLMRIVRALGGELKLVAQFPDIEVVINQFKK
jgi:transcriptional regulator with XRE-family HTH domain